MDQASAIDVEKRRPWRLRTRLALALLAVFIPVSVLVVLSHLENLEDRREAKIESFKAIGDTLAALVDGFTRDMESFALSTAITLGEVSPETLNESSAAFRPYLAHLAEAYGNLRTIFITDLNGRVIAGSTGEGVGTDLSDRNYIQALQQGADTAWSGAIIGSQSRQTTLAHARAVKSSDGQRRFFLVFAFYPNQLVRRLPEDLPADARLSLIDDKGRTIYVSDAPDPNSPPTAEYSSWPVYQTARGGEAVLIRSETTPLTPDEKRYGAYVPVQHTNWVVGVTVPKTTVDGPLESRFRRDLLIISGLLLAGFVAMLVTAARLSRPLTTLAAAADAIARGERPVVPGEAGDADVLKLETAMASMSEAVREREERLEAQARTLQTLERVGESLATELDYEKAVASITQATVDVTGADTVALFHRGSEPADAAFETLSLAGPESIFPMTVDDPLLKRVFRGETVYVQDLAVMPGTARVPEANGHSAMRSFFGIPVVSRTREVQGGLFLLDSDPNAFSVAKQELATGLARRASITLENARLYSEARQIQDQLRQANAAKDEFLALISHELRTPITTIFGGARLLQTRRRSLPEEALDEMIGSIEGEAERLYRLVEDLLAIARADLNEEVVREPLSFMPVVDQVVKQFANRHPGRPLDVHGVHDTYILGETTYVQQVLTNLISNADKYSDSGLPIELRLSAEEGEGIVRVLDRGPGVPDNELDQIFERFYRSKGTAKQAPGKGLGLTVCKRLVEAMSGRIWARPREGGGLEVGFALPLAIEDSIEVGAVES